MDEERTFTGHQYTRDFVDKLLPAISNKKIYTIRLEPWSIEFWVEN
jgi:hypothetical protein